LHNLISWSGLGIGRVPLYRAVRVHREALEGAGRHHDDQKLDGADVACTEDGVAVSYLILSYAESKSASGMGIVMVSLPRF
jgi:hypothetical protein